jgi:hypothetical protein
MPRTIRPIWFAGNHADVGGSYPENESRLSDITLAWMVDFITKEIPAGGQIIVDPAVLKLYPSSDGMMHDECMVGVGGTSIRWNQAIRDVPDLRTCMLPSMNDCVCPKSETLQAMGHIDPLLSATTMKLRDSSLLKSSSRPRCQNLKSETMITSTLAMNC